MSDLKDKTLQCKDCGKDFVYTVKDQEFYTKMNFEPPKRCKDCRKKKKEKNSSN